MSAKIKTLLDKLGNKLYPKTKTSAVYDDNNVTLDTILSGKQNSTDNNLETTAKTIVGAINEINGNGGGGGVSERLITTKTNIKPELKTWIYKTWSGYMDFNGGNVWTDGENIYCSYNENQYVLDKKTSTWSAKTWSGLTSFNGFFIWNDGKNIYYSNGSNQYVLNKETSTWSVKTWSGLTSFDGYCIWNDGKNIYYSNGSNQYVLNKTSSTWSAKTWSGLTSFNGNNIWTDGINIYYSYGSNNHYVLNKTNSTWSVKTWSGLSDFSGNYIWSDGANVYYSYSEFNYVLNKETSTWSVKTWDGLSYLLYDFWGCYIWTDGTNIYYSNEDADQYVLTNKYNDTNLVSSEDINNIEGQISTLNSQLTNWTATETIEYTLNTAGGVSGTAEILKNRFATSIYLNLTVPALGSWGHIDLMSFSALGNVSRSYDPVIDASKANNPSSHIYTSIGKNATSVVLYNSSNTATASFQLLSTIIVLN